MASKVSSQGNESFQATVGLPSSVPIALSLRKLRPIRPSMNRRYDELVGPSLLSESTSLALPAGIYKDKKGSWSATIEGWEARIHPEGKPYFYHSRRRVVTGSNLLLSEAEAEIMSALEQLSLGIDSFSKENDLPEDSEFFLELNGSEYCDYYVVSVYHHTVFWLCEGVDLLELPDDASATTIRLKLEEEFWIHVSFFPMHCCLSNEDEQTLKSALVFACADQMTAPGSTSYLTSEACRQYLYLLDSANSLTIQGSRTWLIARVMTTITRNRNQNYYGQDGARLDRNQESIESFQRSATLLNSLIDGPFLRRVLFNAYVEYEKAIRLTAVDDVVLPQPWKSFMITCQRDWETTMAMAGVLVLANTSLLRNASSSGWILEAIYISTVFSLGSFLLALYHLRTHRGLEATHAYTAAAYLQHSEHETLGYTPLAIYLSFSHVLFIWAIIAFSVAVMLGIPNQ